MAQLSHSRRTVSRSGEQGYILLALLLIIALGIIFAAAIVPSITFNIRRDREEEMIHRGVQYSRAIRAYYKKFGRYPTKMEDLENTNNLRFLRKRYKDPLTGQDFKLLHFGEVQLSLSGIGGGSIPGASPIGGSAGGLAGGPAGSGGFSQQSSFGGNTGGAFGANSGGSFGGNNGGSGGFSGNSSFGANSNSSFGQSSSGQNQQTTGTSTSGTDPSQTGSQTNSNSSSSSSPGSGDGTSATNSGSNGSNQIGSGQIIGGPIVGVASISKDKTIREFNHKTKYKDWVFVYDPGMDRGGIITTPYQPQLMGFGQQGTPNLNGQTGSNGTTGTGFGNSSSFGSGNSGNSFGSSPSGTQNSPNGGTGGFSTPNPPPNNPPQQQ